MSRRLFWLYRPTAPSVRAQSVQVVHAAHASAARGHRVTLCVQAARAGTSARDVLGFYGLEPLDTLDLRVLPAGNTAASIAFRAAFARWAVHGGVVVARSKRYAAEAVRWARGRFDLVIEAHEVDSLLATERGEDPGPARELEARVFAAARGIVCNADGTAAMLRATHPDAPAIEVLHNATHRSRRRRPEGAGEGIGYAGSLRAAKDPSILADLARILDVPVTVVGPDRDEALVARSGGRLRFEPELPHRELPDRLVRFAVLAVPVGPGLFGERLTSPLKLWDYLAVGRPVLAADTPALRSAAGEAASYFCPGDAEAMARAARDLLTDPALARRRVSEARLRLRTWDQRAAELDAFLDRVIR